MRAAIYVRVSTEEQLQGYSMNSQVELCIKKAKDMGINEKDIQVYREEGLGGSFLERPALDELRIAVNRGQFDVVLCYDPDRFSRRTAHLLILTEEFEKKNVKIEYVNFDWQDTPEGKMFLTIRGAIAEYERAKIKERMRFGWLRKAREGKLPTMYEPFGYRYLSEVNNLEIIEEEAEVVRDIFDMFIRKGVGFTGIAGELNRREIKCKKTAKKWGNQVIRQMITNPAYKGQMVVNKTDSVDTYHNKWRTEENKVSRKIRPESDWIYIDVPAIIDEVNWNKAQELAKKSKTIWSGQRKHKYILTSIIWCAACGKRMRGVYQKRKDLRTYTCYLYTRTSQGGCRPARYLSADGLEKTVWDYVNGWLNDPTKFILSDNLHRERQKTQKELDRLHQEKKKTEKIKNTVWRQFERGHFDENELDEKMEEITNNSKNIKSRIKELQSDLETSIDFSGIKENAREILNYLDSDMSFEEKRALLHLLVKKLIVFNNGEVDIYLNYDLSAVVAQIS